MSFSSDTKNELSKIIPEKRCCMLAEISGFVRLCGTIRLAGNNKLNIKLTTENPAAARAIIILLKNYFGIHTGLTICENQMLKKHHFYELAISSEMNAEQILRETGILDLREGCSYISDSVPADIVKKKCCKRAYLRGAFLGAGSVSDPEKAYHLEIVCAHNELSEGIRDLINSFGLNAKIVSRKKNHVIYLKEGEQIVDFLNVIGAHHSLLDLENIRIIKEMRNKANRLVNCETANLTKTVDAAVRHIENILYIQKTRGLEILPDKLREAAELRIENREASLQELAQMFSPPVGKSGVNHRFKKIEEIAEKIRKGEI